MTLDLTQIGKMLLIFIFFIFQSCSNKNINEDNIQGVYIGNFQNNIDTLKITENNEYVRTIYSKDSTLIFKNLSEWEISEGELILKDFLLNNNKIEKNKKYLNIDLITVYFPIESSLGKFRLIENYDQNLFYKKIK
ncbi:MULTISPECIES: hypothetical protein [Mesonia]|uniref:Uncharacterized protein n=1 Tax=Mesonia oceanica TaxID=2687242 RepID=A0AC61Y3J6_9FLAO|nr:MULTISPECIES: hypothetical protein [Mesonia]VVU99036.1 hypothetical protein FVB9532_00286 [Mesonia oceanica]|tara:strand:- start:167 stop:574 length:408 start_codon:yes stop_codon:yes gene_type:complete